MADHTTPLDTLRRELQVRMRPLVDELDTLEALLRASGESSAEVWYAEPAEAGASEHRRDLIKALDRVQRSFREVVAEETGPSGFIADSESRAPHLVHALESLRHEQTQVQREIESARAAALRGGPRVELDCLADGVVRSVRTHLARGHRLAMEIANRDMGPAD
jgi:hypothetical protein